MTTATRQEQKLVIFCYSDHYTVTLEKNYVNDTLGIFTSLRLMIRLVKTLNTFTPDVRGCDTVKLILS